jgi:putative hydrolase of the HAD superfamily
MHDDTQTFPGWSAVDSVFLDMDGTLLDLYFDNYFWMEHVPLRFGERHGLSAADAREALLPRFRAMEGTLQWYCLDHWSKELDLDIVELKREVQHLIQILPHAEEFLQRLRGLGKRLVLVTNAHSDALALKMERTRLEGYFDRVVSSHDFGTPKESAGFWKSLAEVETFDPARTLLADDSLPVLEAARDHGIRYLIAMRCPDSRRPARDMDGFQSVDSLAELLHT